MALASTVATLRQQQRSAHPNGTPLQRHYHANCRAVWERLEERSGSGWDVLQVYQRCMDGRLLHLGTDNTNPNEVALATEKRIGERFGKALCDLVLRIV